MSSDLHFEPEVDISGTTPPARLTATQSLAKVFMAEGNGRYTVILPDSSAALAAKSGATDGTERTAKQEKGGKGGKGARGGKTRGGKAARGGPAFTGMGRMGCNGFGRCNGSCLDRGGKTCNGGVRGPNATEEKTEAAPTTPEEPPKKNRVLVDLHSAFHNTVRVARHSIVLIDLAKAPESLKKGSRVVGTIVNVIRNPEVWCKADYWPYAQYEPPAKAEDKIASLMPRSDSEEDE
ncbi:hypothetical protein SEUCBS139899_004438 [Sporothrix eucalyptigena]|uniref:Uncharacterized protein n=1 Tax=Sporothrix eucalyptigena TaxID=1812306 RepID=A0ABP0CFG6_9PEZI